jgi:ABC-2 type transport system permease protein
VSSQLAPLAASPAASPSPLASLAGDTGLIFGRYLRELVRSKLGLVFGLMQPLLFLILFGPLLRDVPLGGRGDAWQTLVPGLLVQLGLFGAAFAGFGILIEKQHGILERMRVTPVNRVALLLGRVLKDVVQLLAQSVLLVLAGVAFGLRAPILGVLFGFALVGLMSAALAALSYALAMRVTSPQEFAPVINAVNLPVMLLSGVLLPMALAPGWLDGLSHAVPPRYIVEAIRAAFVADYGHSALIGVLSAITLVAASMALAVRPFRSAGD